MAVPGDSGRRGQHGLSSARIRHGNGLTLGSGSGPKRFGKSSTGFPKAKVTVVWARSHCHLWTLALCQVAPLGPEAQAWPGMDGPQLPPVLPRDPRAVVLGVQMRIFRGAEALFYDQGSRAVRQQPPQGSLSSRSPAPVAKTSLCETDELSKSRSSSSDPQGPRGLPRPTRWAVTPQGPSAKSDPSDPPPVGHLGA